MALEAKVKLPPSMPRRRRVVLGACAALAILAVLPVAPGQAQVCRVTLPVGPGNDLGTSVAVQTDGKIVMAGYSWTGTDDQFVVVRYNPNFTLDSSFDRDGVVTTNISAGEDRAEAIALQPDGRILVAGHRNSGAGNNDFAIVRYNANGGLDGSFGAGGIVTTAITGGHDEIEGVAVQSDGKIVVAGWSQRATLDYVVARYNADGSLDTSGFNSPLGYYISTNGATNDASTEVAIQPSDGKIVIAGWANSGASDDFAASRFNTNGTLDAGFAGGTVLVNFLGFLDRANTLVIQPDGKILLTGEVRDGTTWAMFGTARLNSNGSLDTLTFNPATGRVTTDFFAGVHDASYGMVLQPDLKIVVGGWANWSGAGTAVDFALARYSANGSLDTAAFNPGGAFGGPPNQPGKVTTNFPANHNDWIDALGLQSDGKIVAAGYSNNGTNNDLALARYTSAGALDTSCAVPINHRSIGAAVDYASGSVTATTGSAIVTGAGTLWQANNRGRGDRIRIDGLDYVVLSVASDTELRLTAPFTGVTGSGKAYLIARQFTTLQTWEACISTGGGSCPYFTVSSGDLVAGNRREVGIAYDDATPSFTLSSTVTIDGSTTDATHTITLTADPPNRHNGVAGAGVVIDANLGARELLVLDGNVTIEWLELRGLRAAGSSPAAIRVADGGVNVLLQNLLIHDYYDTAVAGDSIEGIRLSGGVGKSVTIRNTMIWDGDGVGIQADELGDILVVENCTIDDMRDVAAAGRGGIATELTTGVVVRNTIATRSGVDFNAAFGSFAPGPTSTNNTSSDGTAPGASAQTGVSAASLYVTQGVDLHLSGGAVAVDMGVDLFPTSGFRFDIDGHLRPAGAGWDRGADESGGSTSVRLTSFEAVGGNSEVMLSWRTGSELDNLGFHLYRGPSADGPWTRLTSSLIPGLGSSPLGQAYSWLDTGLVNGVRYYYRLEDVDTASVSTFHGPVSAVPVPSPPGEDGDGEGGGDGTEHGDPGFPSCPAWVLAAAPDAVSPTCTRYGDPDSVFLNLLARDASSATLELRTGGFWSLREASGTVRVFVPGLEFPSDPQAPALPLRRALVEAVVGKQVDLVSAEASELRTFPELRVSAVGVPEAEVSRDGTVRPARRSVAAPVALRGYQPREVARLSGTVFQGERKSAVVEIFPVRSSASRGELVLAGRVRVRLAFTGVAEGESGRGSRGRLAPRKGAVWREVLAQLHTSRRGLHAVRFEDLFPRRGRGLSTLFLRLQRQGEAVAFHVEPQGPVFGPGSVLYFFADRTAASTEFSGEVAYELVRSSGLRMRMASACPHGTPASSSSTGFSPFETNRIYQPGLLEAPDVWLWEGMASGVTRTAGFTLSGADTASSEPARLVVDLQGGSESGVTADHHVQLSVNGGFAGEATFGGKRAYRLEVLVPAALLREGANELGMMNVGDTGVSSLVFLDRFEISYPQVSTMRQGVFEGVWGESGTVEVGGLAGPPFVLDVTGPVRWVSGFETTPGSVRFQAEAGHRYLVVCPEGLLSPRSGRVPLSTLRKGTNQADYLVIGPRELLEAAGPLLERRRSQGLSSRAVAFEEIASEFGRGQPSAEAIRSFLSYAYHSWRPPAPRYVLLLGDATYDPRRFLATSWASPLPALWTRTSYLWTASDPALAAVNGEDALPDLAIGRLPATTPGQAEALVSKLLAWEDSGQDLAGRAVLVADNPDLGGDFEADVEDVRSAYLAGRPTEVLKLRELGASTRPAILDSFDRGASLVSYVGHGGSAVWANENVLNSWDTPSLRAQSRQPFVLTMNCLNGYFVAPSFDALSEALLKAEGRGAIAAFSPSGLSLDGPAHRYHRAVMAELTSGAHERLGDVLLAAQRAYAESGLMPELLAVYHLIGDPALRIR